MEQHDEMLWATAKKRAAFRKQLISYILVNSFMWGIWFMSGNRINQHSGFPMAGLGHVLVGNRARIQFCECLPVKYRRCS
jgi:hypothetical protein